MQETLTIPTGYDGQIWRHQFNRSRRQPHHHAELEFNLVTQGRAVYLLGERRYELSAGMLVWLFPAQDHVLLDESAEFACWIGVFLPDMVERVCADAPSAVLKEADPQGQFCRRLQVRDAESLDALLDDVLRAQGEWARFNAGLGYALLSAWAAFGTCGEQGETGSAIHPAVERAVRLLRDDPDAAGLAEVARAAGLGASRLSRLFKAQVGVSLLDFRDGQRMERFLRLYGNGRETTLLEASLEAGWGSYPQFHRVFTKRMGRSPGQFRREKRSRGTAGTSEAGSGAHHHTLSIL